MTSPGNPGESRNTASIRVSLATPSFYSPQRKYAPVVAPKPKVNPFKPTASGPEPGPAVSRPEPGPTVTPAVTRSSSRALLGRVGEFPEPVPSDDLLPPPPPPTEAGALPTPGLSPPPPPPPPFEDFPPPPPEDSFPTPPSPLAEYLPIPEAPRAAEVTEGRGLAGAGSLESEIDTLTSLLDEMEREEPRRAKVTPSAPVVNSKASGVVPAPSALPAAKSGPKVTGFSPVKAPKPQVPIPGAQAWAGLEKQRAGPVSMETEPEPGWKGAPASRSGPGKEDRSSALASESKQAPMVVVGPSVERSERSLGQQAAVGPGVQQKPGWGPAGQEERPGSQRLGDTRPLGQPTVSVGEAAPLSYKDVEELENLARQLILEMDRQPQAKAEAAERCWQCGKELSRSQSAVKAMGRFYHVECFVCSSCRAQLQGQQFFEVDGRPLCEPCHQETLEKCSVCQQPITERMLRATGKAFHPRCFTCSLCKKPLEGEPFIVDQAGAVYCAEDYHRRYAPKCSVCNEPIVPEEGKEETVRIMALDKNFHVKCYRCEDCKKQLSTDADENGCYPLDDHVLCLKCHTVRVSKGPSN